jgi:hypothetical protein
LRVSIYGDDRVELMLRRVFQRQVQFQCQAALVAAHDLESSMVTHDIPRMWIAVQGLLTAAANISKALWGQKGRLADERAPLRESLAVDDSSPLRDVALRNHFEHYDERLDRWWATSPAHNHLDMGVLSGPNAVVGFDDIDMFRVLDPLRGEVVFWGERFNLARIIQAAAQLLPVAQAEADKPHGKGREPSSAAGDG